MIAHDLRLALPNVITVARLCVVPITVYLIIVGEIAAAFWLFVAAGISDAVDGFLAKQWGARTVIGGYLDPLADKALLVSVYVSLGHQGYLAAWLVILVVFRDALIVAGVTLSHALGHPFKLQPLLISKINTGLQIALAALVMAQYGLKIELGPVVMLLTFLTAASTLASGAAYIVQGLRGAARIEGASR
jgi:cardiolipin synthase (CMP-forming)